MSIVPFERPQRRQAADVVELLPTYVDLAERIANTEFVPKDLRRRPEAVLAALMSGAERGLGPMEALRSIHVIEGRPSLSAEIMRALVLQAGHEIEIVESTAQKATVVGRRRGSTSTSPPFTWTIDRARRARLAGKDNWVKYPEAMLLARASTDLCRAVFPDIIAGLASTEEVVDETALEPTSTRRAPARRPAAVAPAPANELAAEVDPIPTAAAAPVDDVDEIAADLERELPEDDEIPGADQPSWGKPVAAAPSNEHDINLGKRIHAEITKAFPDVPAATRDRWRHALVAVITRKRTDGPVTSSNDLNHEEQLFLSDLVTRIAAGQATVSDGPDDTIEMRAGGGWRYTITLDPPTVDVRQGDPDPGDAPTSITTDTADIPDNPEFDNPDLEENPDG